MASITTWTRLEPTTRGADLRSGLEARVHDPLWSLARQWQIGEFDGEDAASPVYVRVRSAVAPLTRLHLGPLTDPAPRGARYDPATAPLETVVERESDGGDGPTPHQRQAAGLQFLRLLTRHGVARYREAYVSRYAEPAPPDAATLTEADGRFVDLLASRVPDADRLRADLRAAFAPGQEDEGRLPRFPPVAGEDEAAVVAAVLEWLGWYERIAPPPATPATAWQPERMEHAFAVGAPTADGEAVLAAPEYPGGHLDWYAFDRASASIGANEDPTPAAVTQSVIPAPVTYRGMPAQRWWELEDAQVDLGAVDAGPDDLLRLLMLGFALDYGNDWFLLPLDQPVGSVATIRSVVVVDSFGGRTLIDAAGQVDAPATDWRLFAHTGSADGPAPDALFLPPVLGSSLESDPIEEVLLLRDEMANLAWAVERRVESPAGTSLDRYELFQERRARARAEAPEGGAVPGRTAGGTGDRIGGEAGFDYRIGTEVPDYWTPLVPVRERENDPSIRLRRGRVIRGAGSEVPVPLGRLLEPGRDLRLFEEEVPRAGARVTRTHQRARWTDGSTHAWIGRRKSAGRGEGYSGLRFDVLERTRDTPRST